MTLPRTGIEISARALRQSLLAPPPPTPASDATSPGGEQLSLDASMVPTAPELLEASPNLQRLCEGYHRIHRHMVARSRRQRLGIAILVAGVGVGAVLLSRSGVLAPSVVSELVVVVALASAAALGMLALLWIRDDRRLRRAQGERLMRALQFNCELAPARLEAFRRLSEPTAAFFDCYAVWRSRHPEGPQGVIGLLGSVTGQRRRVAV